MPCVFIIPRPFDMKQSVQQVQSQLGVREAARHEDPIHGLLSLVQTPPHRCCTDRNCTR